MLLKKRKCEFHDCDSESTSVYGSNPYCRDHCTLICCDKNEKNVFNEIRCNSTLPMKKYNNKMYCNSHFRNRIKICSHKNCFTYRDNNKLCYDNNWYCSKHKLDDCSFISEMIKIFDNSLPIDIIEKISKIHLKNATYKI